LTSTDARPPEAEPAGLATARLVSAMHHELRTPLNAVIGFAEIMREELAGPLGAPDYKEYAALIHSSGTALLEMITHMVEFARADAGILVLRVADVELLRLLRSVVLGVREEAAAGGAAAALELEAQAGTLGLRADEQRLRQMLRAVLVHALKSTPADGRVSVRVRPLRGGGAEVAVEGGTGNAGEAAALGLKLAERLARLHGGMLALEGARTVLRLPPAPPAA
jgi:signal transduction histidine kinase